MQIINIYSKAQVYLDDTFGDNGIVITDDSYHLELAYAIALQTDGKIVVAGNTSAASIEDFLVVRYNTDGSLDTSFGNNGFSIIDFGNNTECAYGIDIQDDGKIVVCGYTRDNGNNHDRFATTRLNTDGTLDNTFNLTGTRIEIIGFDNYSYARKGYDVEVLADGKIIVGGTSNEDYAFVKYTTSGNLYSLFGSSGKVEYDLDGNYGEQAVAIGVDNNDKIVASGYSYRICTTEMGIIRLNSDGSIDNSFSYDGQIVPDIALGSEYAKAMAFQPDGKIITVGYNKDTSGYYDIEVIRLTENGDLDNTFGTNGSVLQDFGYNENRAYAVAIEDNGDILVAGSFGTISQYSLGLVRFKSDGSLDNSFGTNGLILSNVGSSSRDRIRALLIQPDGKYLAAGHAYKYSGDFLVARYLPQESKIIEIGSSIIDQNIYPNPSNESFINLEYELKKKQLVKIELIDINGKLINLLLNEKSIAGKQNKTLAIPSDLQSGCYFVKITTEQNSLSLKLLIK